MQFKGNYIRGLKLLTVLLVVSFCFGCKLSKRTFNIESIDTDCNNNSSLRVLENSFGDICFVIDSLSQNSLLKWKSHNIILKKGEISSRNINNFELFFEEGFKSDSVLVSHNDKVLYEGCISTIKTKGIAEKVELSNIEINDIVEFYINRSRIKFKMTELNYSKLRIKSVGKNSIIIIMTNKVTSYL